MSCAINDVGPGAKKLAGELSIVEVADTASLLLDAVSSSETLSLDLSDVTELDTAGLQLLMLLKYRCSGVSLVSPSEPVQKMIHLFRQHSMTGEPAR